MCPTRTEIIVALLAGGAFCVLWCTGPESDAKVQVRYNGNTFDRRSTLELAGDGVSDCIDDAATNTTTCWISGGSGSSGPTGPTGAQGPTGPASAGTLTRVATSDQTTSTVANQLYTSLTSPSYTGGTEFSVFCAVVTIAVATSGARFGIGSAGSVTTITLRAHRATSATADTISDITALATATCSAGCTAAVTSSGATTVMTTKLYATGVKSDTGTLFLGVAPSSTTAVTIKRGSFCIWY